MTPSQSPRAADSPPRAIAIVGAGSIGTAFAVVFAAARHRVSIQDPSAGQRDQVRSQVALVCADLQRCGLLQEQPEAVVERIEVCAHLERAAAGADYVQECAPEDLELKRELFAQLDAMTPPDAILASASSAMPASAFAASLCGASRCLVAHPGNPPFLLRVVEVVPAPFTAAETVARAVRLLESVGLSSVVLRREIKGFVFNRLQGALLREAYCLVRDGVVDVAAVDRIVRDGLGLRWSVVGPFETVDLNTRGGIASHARKLGPAYAEMGAERGQHDPWTDELVASVERQRRELLPLDQWEQRVRWRDRALMAVLAARRRIGT